MLWRWVAREVGSQGHTGTYISDKRTALQDLQNKNSAEAGIRAINDTGKVGCPKILRHPGQVLAFPWDWKVHLVSLTRNEKLTSGYISRERPELFCIAKFPYRGVLPSKILSERMYAILLGRYFKANPSPQSAKSYGFLRSRLTSTGRLGACHVGQWLWVFSEPTLRHPSLVPISASCVSFLLVGGNSF